MCRKSNKNRKTRGQRREDKEEIHASAATGRFAKGADVLFAKDLADLLFKLHIGEGATTSKEKFDSKCLAQIIVLSYIYGSRVEDIFDLPPENLIQDRCELSVINFKKANLKRQQKMPRHAKYIACVFPAEREAWSKLWKYFGFNQLERPLLFKGKEYDPPGYSKWKNEDSVRETIQRHYGTLGECYRSFTGERAHITLHTYRRSRGVHLLQHGFKIQDVQAMYQHCSLDVTKDYVEVGRSLQSLRGEVTFEEGVLSLLCQRLETHYGDQIPVAPSSNTASSSKDLFFRRHLF